MYFNCVRNLLRALLDGIVDTRSPSSYFSETPFCWRKKIFFNGLQCITHTAQASTPVNVRHKQIDIVVPLASARGALCDKPQLEMVCRWKKILRLVRYAVMSSTRTVHGTPLKHTREHVVWQRWWQLPSCCGFVVIVADVVVVVVGSVVRAYHQRAPLVLPFLCLCKGSRKKLGGELWVNIDEQPKASGTIVIVVSFIRTFIRWTLFRRRVISRTINQRRRAYSEWRLNELNQEPLQWWKGFRLRLNCGSLGSLGINHWLQAMCRLKILLKFTAEVPNNFCNQILNRRNVPNIIQSLYHSITFSLFLLVLIFVCFRGNEIRSQFD